VLSTPLGPGDVALGELTWSLMRATVYSTAFLIVMAGYGYVLSPWAVLCLPAAMLIQLRLRRRRMAATTYMRSWQDFDKVSLALIPLFLVLRQPSTPCRCIRAGSGRGPLAPPVPRVWCSCVGLDLGIVSWVVGGPMPPISPWRDASASSWPHGAWATLLLP